MRVVINTVYSLLEVVKLMEIDAPLPKENEVIIKVHVATVNRTDCGFRSAEYFISRFFSGLTRNYQSQINNMNQNNIVKFIVCILLPLAMGSLSGFLSISSMMDWYPSLNKPFFNPPNSIFGPVWTILYFLMGISIYMIWINKTNSNKIFAVMIFIIQMILNFLWSLIFFFLRRPDFALVDILLLFISIYIMIQAFKKINVFAAYLQIPYLVWVGFASILNFSIWIMN
jgi:benzodiazapine receptor